MTDYYYKLAEAQALYANLKEKDIPAKYAIARELNLKLDTYN